MANLMYIADVVSDQLRSRGWEVIAASTGRIEAHDESLQVIPTQVLFMFTAREIGYWQRQRVITFALDEPRGVDVDEFAEALAQVIWGRILELPTDPSPPEWN